MKEKSAIKKSKPVWRLAIIVVIELFFLLCAMVVALFYTTEKEKGHVYTDGVIVQSLDIYEHTYSVIDSYYIKNLWKYKITIPDTCRDKPIVSIESKAFENCTALTTLNIPDSITHIANGAFDGCKRLIQKEKGILYVDDWAIGVYEDVENVSLRAGTVGIADNAFEGCFSLKSIVMPDGFKYVGNYAFYGCENLTDATIPNSAVSIGNSAFYNCKQLKSVNLYGVVTIDKWAFTGCSSLINVTTGKNLTTIDEWAFCDCTQLESIIIPLSVRTISWGSFYGDHVKLTIYCEAEKKPYGWINTWNNGCPVVWGYTGE